MKRKLLLTFLTILISVFAFSTISVSAATSGTCGTNLKWTVDDREHSQSAEMEI